MDDTKQDRAETQKTTEELLAERQSDATNDETVKDVAESRADLAPDENNRAGAISPDGALDESEESEDAGPM